MERIVILKNTVTGQDLTMPVTPKSYPVASGRAVERLDMAQTGQIALPGLKTLFSEVLEVMFPAQLYPFCTADTVADPRYYIDLLTAWSNDSNVCRYIVVGAGVNYPVLLGPLEYEEHDGSNDVYARIPLYEYRYLEEVQVETTQNGSRPTESSNQTATAGSYTVEEGDSLWSICKKIYGDGSLAAKLAAANGITNLNLIYPGQVLVLPDFGVLTAQPTPEAPSETEETTTPTKSKESEEEAREATRAAYGMTSGQYTNPAYFGAAMRSISGALQSGKMNDAKSTADALWGGLSDEQKTQLKKLFANFGTEYPYNNPANFGAAMRSIAGALQSGQTDRAKSAADTMWSGLSNAQKSQVKTLFTKYGIMYLGG